MSIFPTKAHRLIPICFALLLTFSCSKDSDLLADYVSPDGMDAGVARFVVDDAFMVSVNASVRLDVLSNDNFPDKKKVRITGTSNPRSGSVSINEDNTITYTSEVEEPITDTFDYTTEVVNEDQTVSQEQGTVTVEITGENIYYVTVSGSSGNDGRTEASAWTIQHAIANVKAGDIIYVKAGDYGNKQLGISTSGTSGNPIKLIGYKNTPGDIVATNGPSYTFENYKANGNDLDSKEMPLLEGVRTNNEGTGIGIKVNSASYIHIENFMLRHFEYGIYSRGDHNQFVNVISTDHGDFNSAHSYPDGTSELHLNLTGNGIWITGSQNVTLSNCLAVNNGARGISVVGCSNSVLSYNHVYSDNNTNPTDYYIMLYKSNNNLVDHCKVERIGKLTHPGHGFSVKVESSYNTYTDCVANGTGFELNNKVNNNTFKDCHVQGTGEPLSGGWEITNYSYANEFINCSNDSGEGIVFSDWLEGDGNNIINTAAFDNTFTNCTITNVVNHSGAIIDFHWNNQKGRLTSFAKNNTFIDCTFSGAKSLFKVDRVNSGNKLINCSISNIPELRHSRYSINETLSLNVSFDNPILLNNVGFRL